MNTSARDLPVVDGLRLAAEVRVLLRADELAADGSGRLHRLPRFFYEVRSWSQAKELLLTPHVRLSELMIVDCQEHPRLLEEFPHYVPCSVGLLARMIEELRTRAGNQAVFVAANGGYRSPAHQHSTPFVETHCWASAVDIYRIGDTYLNTQHAIEKYGTMARELGPEVNTLPFGHQAGESDDHLHLDLGHLTLVSPSCDECPL